MSSKNSYGSIKDYTPHYKLIIPEFDIATWHDYMEKNFRNIDALFYNLFGINNYSGDWEQLTEYKTGQILFIGEDLNSEEEETVYSGRLVKVLQNHTTDNSEYFNLYYEQHPEYYELFADASTAQLFAQQAQQSAAEAKTSETNAKESETKAKNSEQTATQKASEASSSAQSAQQLVTTFESNVTSYTNSFNNNAETKTNDYNANSVTKTSTFNQNFNEKLSSFNTNATEKIDIVNNLAQQAQTSATNAANSEQNAAQSAENAKLSAASVDADKIKRIGYEGLTVLNCSGEVTLKLKDTDEIVALNINDNATINFDVSELTFPKFFYTVQVYVVFPNGSKTVTLNAASGRPFAWINGNTPNFSSGKAHWLVFRTGQNWQSMEASDAGEVG